MLIFFLPAFAHIEESELIKSFWLTDRILIVGTSEMQMDMVAAVNTEKGIVIIDSGMSPSLTSKHRSLIEKEFGRSDFKYVINTHHHNDHTNGNQVFKDAVIIAQKNAVKRMQDEDVEEEITAYVKQTRERNERRRQVLDTLEKESAIYKKLNDRIYVSDKMCDDYETVYHLTLPTATFTDTLNLNMGDLNIELVYFGPDFHSDNDIIVSIPEENIVFTGDLLRAMDQYYDVKSNSDIESWIACLDKIVNSKNEIKNIVAYHVGILPGSILIDFYNSLKAMRNEQRHKKSAVDSLREMLSVLNIQDALTKFEDQFIKNRNEECFIWEGDLLSLAKEYEDKEKYDKAVKILKMSEKIFPNSTRILYGQARIFTELGENHLAIEAYKKMLSIDPTNYYYVEMIFQLKNIE